MIQQTPESAPAAAPQRSPLIVIGVGAFGGGVVRRLGEWALAAYPAIAPITRFLHVPAGADGSADLAPPPEWLGRIDADDPSLASRLGRAATEVIGLGAVEAARDQGIEVTASRTGVRPLLMAVADVAEPGVAPAFGRLLRTIVAELFPGPEHAAVVALGAVSRGENTPAEEAEPICPPEIAQLLREPAARTSRPPLRYYVLDGERDDGARLTLGDLQAAALQIAKLLAAPSRNEDLRKVLLGEPHSPHRTAVCGAAVSWVEPGFESLRRRMEAELGRRLLEGHTLAPVAGPDDLAQRLRALPLLYALRPVTLCARLCEDGEGDRHLFRVVPAEVSAPSSRVELDDSVVEAWTAMVEAQEPAAAGEAAREAELRAQEEIVAPAIARVRETASALGRELATALGGHLDEVVAQESGPAVAGALLAAAEEQLAQPAELRPAGPPPELPAGAELEAALERAPVGCAAASAVAATLALGGGAWALLALTDVGGRLWGAILALVAGAMAGGAAYLYLRAQDRARREAAAAVAEALAERAARQVREAVAEGLRETRLSVGQAVAARRDKVARFYDELSAVAQELRVKASMPAPCGSALAIPLREPADAAVVLDQQELAAGRLPQELASKCVEDWGSAGFEALRDRVERFCAEALTAPRLPSFVNLLERDLAGASSERLRELLDGLDGRSRPLLRPGVALDPRVAAESVLVVPDEARLISACSAPEIARGHEVVAGPPDMLCVVRVHPGVAWEPGSDGTTTGRA